MTPYQLTLAILWLSALLTFVGWAAWSYMIGEDWKKLFIYLIKLVFQLSLIYVLSYLIINHFKIACL